MILIYKESTLKQAKTCQSMRCWSCNPALRLAKKILPEVISKTFGRCIKSKVIFPKERLRNGSRLISVKVLTETPVQYG